MPAHNNVECVKRSVPAVPTVRCSPPHARPQLPTSMAAATPDEAMLQRVLGVAKAAAQKAGDLMRANKGAVAVAHTKDGDKDLVTVVDKQCEDVCGAISAARPAPCTLPRGGPRRLCARPSKRRSLITQCWARRVSAVAALRRPLRWRASCPRSGCGSWTPSTARPTSCTASQPLSCPLAWPIRAPW